MERRSSIECCYFFEYDSLLLPTIDNVELAYGLFICQKQESYLTLLQATLNTLNTIIASKKISIKIKNDIKEISSATVLLNDKFYLIIKFALFSKYNSPVRYSIQIDIDELKTIRFISNKNLIANN